MMRIFTLFLCPLLLCISAAYTKLYPVNFFAVSVRSHIFAPLRPTTAPEVINKCGKLVSIPYGLLEITLKRGEVKPGEKCTWRLRAPTKHRVNVISTAFDLLDPISESISQYDDSTTSDISFYDSGTAGKNLMSSFAVSPRERAGGYLQSISSKEDMVVEITYRDNVDYVTQKIKINYEFLDADKMIELLKAQG